MWLLALLTACTDADVQDSGADSGGTPADAACADAYDVTWANWANGFFLTYCRSCHSSTTSDRRGAPEGLDYDTLAQVEQGAAAIENAVLVDERMPVGGGVYEDDLTLLRDFLTCGLPPG